MRRRLLLNTIALALLLASCAQPAASPTPAEVAPVPTATVAPTPTAEPAAKPVPVFERAACPFQVPEGQAVECGFVVVPEDHSDPTGRTIRIAVAVFKDQSDEHKPDPVMLLSGGPGEKTVGNAAAVAQMLAPIHSTRDFIVFDQRGVGLSEPALECPEYVQALFESLDERELNTALRSTFNALMACRGRLVSEGHNLSAYNTAQNASDVNAIRTALDYDQVNLWGGSYGSHLAQAVMRDHPEGIRSVVLESVWPLQVSFSVETSATVPKAILRLLDTCAADEACNSAYPNLREVIFEVIDRLNAEPVPITVTNPVDGRSYDALLTGDGVLGNLKLVLYETPTMPTVPQAIYNVYNGDYALMTQLASLRLAYFDAISRGMQYSMMCTDDLIGRTPQEIIDIHAALPRQLVGNVDYETAVECGIFGVCEEWPVEEAAPSAKEPLVSDIPTLVLSGEFDPVTPPEFGRLVAGYLSNSYFFEFPGAGHSGDSTSPCALGITAAFIDDPTTAPDASCIADMPGLVFAVPSEGADVVLVPYTNEELGLSGVVPAGWTEVNPGLFARGHPAVDMAVLQLSVEPVAVDDLLRLVVQNYGLEQRPQSTAERQAGDLTWSLYAFQVQGVPRDLALAQSEGVTLLVLMRSAVGERDALYEAVFLPALDALVPLR
jgi:pimeloyl-ACP methyl ester carboxylesterase